MCVCVCFEGVLKESHGCFMCCFKGDSGCLNGVLQVYLRGVLLVFQGTFKGD